MPPAPLEPAPLVPNGFFVLRTPLLPVDELRAFGRDLEAPGAAPEGLPAALARDHARGRARLQALLARADVDEAVFLASPSLHESMTHWRRDPESERGQKIERALTRYVARMTMRATPFGLFAGCGLGRIGARTTLALTPRAAWRRRPRLDSDYLWQLCAAIAHDPARRPALVVAPSSSLYRIGDRLRYVEGHLRDGQRVHELAEVVATEAITAALARARGGRRVAELVTQLAEELEVPRAEASLFVDGLIDAQLLVPTLTPPVTGADATATLAAELATIDPPSAAALADVDGALAALAAEPIGVPPARYAACTAALAALPARPETARLYQVDLWQPTAAATLGEDVVNELRRGVALLQRFGVRLDPLARFRDAFVERYGEREVPLVEALDDGGIGFDDGHAELDDSPLTAGLPLGDAPPAPRSFGARDKLLLSKLQEATRAGAHAIELADAEVTALPPLAPLPDALSALGTLATRDAGALARGAFQLHLSSVGGPSGATLLGRFCHADPDLADAVRAHLAAEEALHPDVVFAELVHLPGGRAGNVLMRPCLRDYEIVYLGRSGAPPAAQLGIEDLLVSVVGPRVVLRSARLGREVRPRLTSAHAFDDARQLPVYRFLCALQIDGCAGPMFDWGALRAAPWLPRVTSGRLVLSLERWRLDAAEIGALDRPEAVQRWQAVQALRTRRGFPRHVVFSEEDLELPIDLDDVLAVDGLAQLVRGRPAAALHELFPAPDDACVQGEDGLYAHELVVPLVRDHAPTPRREPPPPAPTLRRSFPPASEWLYARVYASPAGVDRVLREAVAPLVASAGAVDRWFFIRYGDPAWHLRLRLHGDATRLWPEVLPMLARALEPLLAAGVVSRWQLDTYERELERYGGDAAMEACERMFCADSVAALAIVDGCGEAADATARWQLALVGMDRLLDALGLPLARRRELAAAARAGFAAELGAGVEAERRLGERFRAQRVALERLLATPVAPPSLDEPLARGLQALAERSAAIAEAAATLRAEERAGRLHPPLDDIAGSLLHMHVNRIARVAPRAQEWVLYDLLERLYTGQLKRRRA